MTVKIKIYFCLVLFLFCPLQAVGAESLPSGLQQIVSRPVFKGSSWGILFVDLENGKTVHSLNPDQLFIPASVIKLFTAASAFEILGADYRFQTSVYALGKTEAGILNGNLILKAVGDLFLGGRLNPDGTLFFDFPDHTQDALGKIRNFDPNPLAGLDELAQKVAESGIKFIAGDVVIDDRLFNTSFHSGPDKFLRTPIIINDNMIDISLSPGQAGELARVGWIPAPLGLSIDAQVVTSPEGSEPDVRIDRLHPMHIVIRGSIPVGGSPVLRSVRVENPVWFARALFIQALRRAGVRVLESALNANDCSKLPANYLQVKPVARLTSPPLSEYLKVILKVSHNLGAEILPLILAANVNKQGFEQGILEEKQALKSLGLSVQSIVLAGGDGGRRVNRVSPRVMVDLLSAIKGKPYYEQFKECLPIMGKDGTLKFTASPGSIAVGQVLAKTGTWVDKDLLNQRDYVLARNLAGYMDAASGKKLAFAIFLNNVPISSLDGSWELGQVLGSICEFVYKNN